MLVAVTILTLACFQDPDTLVQEADAAVLQARLRAARTLEGLKAWGWARAEYRKILRLDPNHESVVGKLQGRDALPATHSKITEATVKRYEKLLQDISKAAAGRYAAVARRFEELDRKDEAGSLWRTVLMYAPADAEALKALGFVGAGAKALDPVWKDVPLGLLITTSDPGEPKEEASDLERAWGIKTTKRAGALLAIEGVDVPQQDLARLLQIGEASMRLMRTALGDRDAEPSVKRFVVMTGRSRYLRYIEDFCTDPANEKETLRKLGSFHNKSRDEIVRYRDEAKDIALEHGMAHEIAEYMLPFAPWLEEGTAWMCELQLLRKVWTYCVDVGGGTRTESDKEPPEKQLDVDLRAIVNQGHDDPLDLIVHATWNALKAEQAFKAASVVRFLMLRRPDLFRAIVKAYQGEPASPAAAIEKETGLTLEEIDEFWRRWYLAN